MIDESKLFKTQVDTNETPNFETGNGPIEVEFSVDSSQDLT